MMSVSTAKLNEKLGKIYYFDNNATTFIHEQSVINEVNEWLNCGNPSNVLHSAGMMAKIKLDTCRKKISELLNVDSSEIIFTGGATEANNILIQGIVNEYLEKNPFEYYSIITSNFEHPSVLNVFNYYDKHADRISVIHIPIETRMTSPYYGSVDPKTLDKCIRNLQHRAILISIMYANNETGAIQDMDNIGKIAKKYRVHLHSDATQAIGKFKLSPKMIGIDSMSFSGHKFHAPKGIGCLYRSKNCSISQICYGGEQENKYRPGTENIAFIAGMTKAFEISQLNRQRKTIRLYFMRKYLKHHLEKNGVICIEPKFGVLPNTILAVLPNIKTCNKAFARELSQNAHICIGISSACQTGTVSHVLNAMKINKQNRDKTIRISMSDYTSIDECDYLINKLSHLLKNYKK